MSESTRTAAEPRWPMATAVLAATILFVGYQGEGTLGAHLQAGAQTVRLDGQPRQVRGVGEVVEVDDGSLRRVGLTGP